ncbi:Helix-turn-helix domain protein [Enterococcus faecium]|uniref:Helix-turn-helix domain protein n=1 Tax=Enterococcus faecium TaxID=1352 RepID=A0ABD7LNG0_ENTFC|nr:Helix-turn-helix domain protein [Enterococcus faecium]
MHIGDKIHKLRRLNNETMNDLVKQTGLSKSWVSDIESGKKQRADFNRIRQKSPILYRWVMNAVRYEGYRW